MRIAAALLESYERQVQSVEGALKVPLTNPYTPTQSPYLCPDPCMPFGLLASDWSHTDYTDHCIRD